MRSISRGPAPTKVTIAPSEARHRANTTKRSANDPHHAPSGVAGELYCTTCGAVHHHKRWTLDAETVSRVRADPSAEATRCPGCEQVANRQFDGEVILESPFLATHGQDIMRLMQHVEQEVRERSNPLARIGEIHWEGEKLTAYTVSPHLADRLGKAVQKAYRGELKTQHADRSRFQRVKWHRED